MPPEFINALSAAAGVVIGALGVLIVLRKMPHEIGQADSSTIRNLSETVETLSKRERDNTDQISALNAIIHGSFELHTRTILRFANPPEVVSSESQIHILNTSVEEDHS